MSESVVDAVLGTWRVRVEYPDAGPPLTFWGATIREAVEDWLREMLVASRDRQARGLETLEDAVTRRGGLLRIRIMPTAREDPR